MFVILWASLLFIILFQIIESKRTDAVNNKKKNECWETIKNCYNSSCCGEIKTIQQLQIIYKNIKANLRKELANEKLERFKTGGGTPNIVIGENPFLPIIEQTTTPLSNPYDSSAQLYEEEFIFEKEVEATAEAEQISSTPALVRTRAPKRKGQMDGSDELQLELVKAKIKLNIAKEATEKAKAEYYRNKMSKQ